MFYIFKYHKRFLLLYGIILALGFYLLLTFYPELALIKLEPLKNYSINVYQVVKNMILFGTVLLSIFQPFFTVYCSAVCFWCATVFLNKSHSYTFFVKCLSISYGIIMVTMLTKFIFFVLTHKFFSLEQIFNVKNLIIRSCISSFSVIDASYYFFAGWLIQKYGKEKKWYLIAFIAVILQFALTFCSKLIFLLGRTMY